MRKTVLLLASMMIALLLASGVAMALNTIRCGGGECNGTRKSDEMLGTARRDIMYAFNGNDKLYGTLGADDLYGFDGNDLAKGGDGNDNLYGNYGADSLYGTEGSDYLKGGYEDDALYGGGGDDELDVGSDYSSFHEILNGGAGDDQLQGGKAKDEFIFGPGWGSDNIYDPDRYSGDILEFSSVAKNLTISFTPGPGPEVTDGTNTVDWEKIGEILVVRGGTGDDTITGDDRENRLRGGAGADTINGGDNYSGYPDELLGEAGNDKLYGQGDNDFINGGTGDDLLDGGRNWDEYFFDPGWGHDTISDSAFPPDPPDEWAHWGWIALWDVKRDLTINLVPGDGPEVTDGTNTIEWSDPGEIDLLFSGSGDDTITGTDDYDSIWGGDGADTINSGGSGDTIYGEAGADNVNAGDGNDRVYAFVNQRDTAKDHVDCGAGDRDIVHIHETNADNAINCEVIRFTNGRGGGDY